MKKRISVIIPIYNAQHLLPRIFKQIKSQTLEGIEWVLIDDCSEDASYGLEEDFYKSNQDFCILLQTPQNSGPGGARNLGLKYASGEYIGFVDADDEIVPDMFQKLYQAAVETNADIVDSGYYNEKLDYAIIHTSDELTGKLNAEKRSALIVSGGYIVSKIFRRELLERHKMQFREHIAMEDSEFLTKAFATADSIANVKEVLYKYSFTDRSSSRERDWRKYYENVTGAMSANYAAVKNLENYYEIQEAVEYLIVQLYNYGILKCLSVCTLENKTEVLEKLEKLRKIKQDSVKGKYSDNKYIIQKISENDIQLMQLNDHSPEKLLTLISS